MKNLSVLSLANEQMVRVKIMTSELIHVEIFFPFWEFKENLYFWSTVQ